MVPGVNVIGYLHSEKGLGEAARGLVRGLVAAGIPHTLNDFPDWGSANIVDWTIANIGLVHNINLLAINPDNLPHFSRCVDVEHLRRGRYTIGYWHWELSEFPAEWSDRFRVVDEVWVSSSFTQDAVGRASPVPVVRMPPALELNPPREVMDSSLLGLPKDAFVFLFAFDAASMLARKNPVGLIRTFQMAFPTEQDVRLVLKTSRLQGAPDREELLTAARGDERIVLLGGALKRAEMLGLLDVAECYVSLHRAEGFGLTLAESMLLGKPVIATGYSGNLDFMTPFNSHLVDWLPVQLDRDYGPYNRGQMWAEPVLEHAATIMRSVFEMRGTANLIGERARRVIASQFNPAIVGGRIRERVERLISGEIISR